jgi:formyl-CoA transferase
MWRRFCAAIGREDLVEKPEFATAAARREHRDALNTLIAEIAAGATTAELVDKFNAAGIPCGPIHSMDQAFADPQVRHLGVTQPVESETTGRFDLLAQPIKLSRTPSTLRSAAPEYGEHNDDVLAELGYSAADIAELRRKQAI